MYELDITRDFSAAHMLVGYDGLCSALHGHNWTVQVFIRASRLDEIGIAADFTVVKRELTAILASFDHKYLNELPEFEGINPTSENIARVLFERLAPVVNAPGVKLDRVRVCESPTSGATYIPDSNRL
ncbi:MAG: 6-carboxytetrahydropterin synthase QueD [Lentisphaeria bacterium]|nr:6-carboxytetrahydropterin synthase QueD [Lentisphaeria bacterium]MBR3505822.1 6-carboxytetrahydropterin synthase QueD [Lentisphaeria bacterium]